MTRLQRLMLPFRNLSSETPRRLFGSAIQRCSPAVSPPVVRSLVDYIIPLCSSFLHSRYCSSALNTNSNYSAHLKICEQFIRRMTTASSHLHCVIDTVSEVLISETIDRPVWKHLNLVAVKILIRKDSAETFVSLVRRNNLGTISTFTVMDFISDYPSRKNYRTCELRVSDGSPKNLVLLIVYSPKQSIADHQSKVQLAMDDIQKRIELEESEKYKDSEPDKKKVLEERIALFGRVCRPLVYTQQRI